MKLSGAYLFCAFRRRQVSFAFPSVRSRNAASTRGQGAAVLKKNLTADGAGAERTEEWCETEWNMAPE